LEIEPNAENATPEELEVAMEASPTKRGYIRLAAIRSMMLGVNRTMVCKLFCRSDRVIRLWIHLFNTAGIDALASKPRRGRPRKFGLQSARALLAPVLENPQEAGQRHWTGVKLHGWLRERLGTEIGYSTTLRYLHELGYNLRVPWPWPDRQDEAQRAAFLDRYRAWQNDPGVEVWFGDECGVEGDPRPRRRWSLRGSRPRMPYCGEHVRANVVGVVCPVTGESFAMIFDGVDTAVFQCYLDELAKTIPHDPAKRRILVLDNASWHKSSRLNFHHFQRAFLPAYSPDYNPIERLWLRLKADHFADFYTDDTQTLVDHLCFALNALMNAPKVVASQCAFRK
jgi:transposase